MDNRNAAMNEINKSIWDTLGGDAGKHVHIVEHGAPRPALPPEKPSANILKDFLTALIKLGEKRGAAKQWVDSILASDPQVRDLKDFLPIYFQRRAAQMEQMGKVGPATAPAAEAAEAAAPVPLKLPEGFPKRGSPEPPPGRRFVDDVQNVLGSGLEDVSEGELRAAAGQLAEEIAGTPAGTGRVGGIMASMARTLRRYAAEGLERGKSGGKGIDADELKEKILRVVRERRYFDEQAAQAEAGGQAATARPAHDDLMAFFERMGQEGRFEGEGAAPTPAPISSASVPAFVTRSMEQGLADLGYSRETIRKMAPAEANRVLTVQEGPKAHPLVRGKGGTPEEIQAAVEQSRAETAAAEGRPLTDAEAARAIQESPFERGQAEAQQQASTPPRPDASGTLGAAGGPPSPLDGKPVFDPVVPPGAPRIGTFWERVKSLWGRRVEPLLPQEAMIAKRIPESTVLSDVKGAHGRVQGGQDAIVKEVETLRRAITPDEWIYAEHKAKQMARAGIEPERILSEVHPTFAAYVRERGARFLEEQTARKVLGLPELPEEKFPYAPRRALYPGEESVRVLKSNEPGRQMESTLQSFGRERANRRSMDENMREKGTRYEDPNLSVLARETVGMHLRETGKLVQDLLDHNVLFTSAKDAMASRPGALAVPVQSLYPGARPFWAASREEAVYIAQNFTGRTSAFGEFGTISRTLLRNPNLTNFFPHEKNMATALLRSGGNPIRTAFVDVAEYRQGVDPLVERFKALDGHTSVLRPASQLYQDEARRIGGGIPAYWTEAKAIARAPLDLNQKILFDLSDPGIRYSLFKTYVGKGLSDQAAWNRAFVDMVNYGTRSTVTDMLSQVPGNFFVPWRVGSLTGTIHAIRDHPFQVALTIGAIDYLREAHYRETGRWFSIPVWDNITRPVTAMIQNPERGWTEAMMLAVSSRLPALWADMMAHKITAGSVAKLFWGMAQWGAIGQDFKAAALDPSGRTISNLVMGLLAGERLTETYQPTRWSSVIPESVTGQSYNERVKAKDTVIEEQRRRAEWRAAVAARRGPRPTPAQRVGLSP